MCVPQSNPRQDHLPVKTITDPESTKINGGPVVQKGFEFILSTQNPQST